MSFVCLVLLRCLPVSLRQAYPRTPFLWLRGSMMLLVNTWVPFCIRRALRKKVTALALQDSLSGLAMGYKILCLHPGSFHGRLGIPALISWLLVSHYNMLATGHFHQCVDSKGLHSLWCTLAIVRPLRLDKCPVYLLEHVLESSTT